jgi:hypothetical protein
VKKIADWLGVVIVFGYAAAAWVGFGCFYTTKPAFQWRFPLSLQCLWPLVLLLLTPVLPESPRWREQSLSPFHYETTDTNQMNTVLMQGRRQEAWDIVEKLHNSEKDSSRISFAREEFYQMTYQVSADQEMARSETVTTLFTKPSYRKRMFCAFMTMFASESTAILVVYNYSVLLYEGLGFSNSISLLLAAAYVTVACCGNYISSLLMDHVGRVKLLGMFDAVYARHETKFFSSYWDFRLPCQSHLRSGAFSPLYRDRKFLGIKCRRFIPLSFHIVVGFSFSFPIFCPR